MKNGERRLHDFIYGDVETDEAPHEEVRRKVIEEFDYGRKLVMVKLTLALLMCTTFLFFGAWWIAKAGDTREMLLGFFLMMIGLDTSVLVKLWYWVIDSRMTTSKEIKQVQLQLAQMNARLEALSPTRGDGGTNDVDA
ncbi:MAG: hypothetical protein IT365_15325 [Candidatus Hydrogenedentes bacterium]|nr:hypothetical protein [Candidatus Hydrogenedentota bacterium]